MRTPVSKTILYCAILSQLLQAPACAAIGGATTWEIWPGSGSDNNGGGFTVGVSAKDNGASPWTDLIIDGALNTKVISGSHNFVTADVFKYIQVTSGTGWTPGWYQILSVAANAATVDHSPAATGTTGGSFNLFSAVDSSQQAVAKVNIDTTNIAATCNTNTITFTGGATPYTAAAADVGNIVQLYTGTNITAGFYEITAQTSTTWTITGAATACTAAANPVTGGMGGALSTLIGPAGAVTVSNKIFVKATGILSMGAGVTFGTNASPLNITPPTMLIGYGSTRADNGRVTIRPTTSGLTLLTFTGNGWIVKNFSFDGTNGANTIGTAISLGSSEANTVIQNAKVNTFTVNGINFVTGNADAVVDSEILNGQSGCTAGLNGSTGSNRFVRNYVHDNACTGIIGGGLIAFNIVAGFTGANGIQFTSGGAVLFNTVDGRNASSVGIRGSSNSSGTQIEIRNNLIVNNPIGLELWTSAGWSARSEIDGNCYYNNGSNRTNSDDTSINIINGVYPYQSQDVVLSASPFTGSGDYNLNTTTGGGAAAKGVGVPGLIPGSTSTGSPSCGAVQPAPGGGVSAYIQ